MANSLASINIKFSADLKQFSSEMQTAVRDVAKLGDSFAAVGRGLTVGLTTPILGLGGLAVKTAADFETLRTSLLSSFQGNQAAADSAFKTIEKFATSSPYQVEEVLNAFIKLKNLGLDPSEEALESYGNTASAMGKSLDQMIEAVADATTGEFERLKEFGIKSKSEGDKVSFTFQGVTTTVGKNSKEIEGYLMNIGNVNFAGAMDRQSETFKGRLSSLQDTFASFGDSIGTIILEFMSPMIDSLQELAEYFKKLSPETQKTIVVIAGLAAAIGPLLLAIGGLMQLVPVMVAGFAAIKGAFASLTASMSANPITAIAVALGLVIAGIYAYTQATNGAVSATKLYADVREVAAKSVAKEKAELDTLLKIAKDETLSKQQRQTAIDKLNKISPEYLGNLRLETINTNEAKKAIDAYNVALNQRALQQAVLSKKTELFNQLIELQNKDLNLTGNAFSDAAQKASNYIFSLLGVETQTIRNRAELEQYIKASKLEGESAKAVRANYEVLIREREKDVKNIQNQIDALDKFNVSEGTAVSVTDKLTVSTASLVAAREKLPMAGTIAFYELEISKLQKLQKEQIKTGYEYLVLQSKIDDFQKKIDEIALKPLEPIKLPPLDNTGFAESALKNSEYYKQMVDSIAAQGERMKAEQEATNEAMKLRAQELNEAYSMIGESFMGLFQSYSQGFVDSLGITNEGMQAFVSSMIGTITKLISMALSASMANSIQGATQSGVATGPAAVFTTPAFIATAIAGIIGAFAAIPKFATGGMVPGTSLYGDKILARVNSGELILNQKQQSNLWGMMQSGGQGVNVNIEGGFRLAGSDLELVIERAVNKNNRKR